ncbi:MAG: glycosyltransferase [Butyrivibrio sp.]|nr:glycosyltransferase [Butyrivibrio sp.]
MKLDVSLIVPVYNVASYIDRFLESVDRQGACGKGVALEVVLVDDGSTDGSGGRCDEYALKHGLLSVKVIHQINAGAAAARNIGLKEACGDYVMFADPDDYLEDDYVEKAFRKICDSGCDIVMFNGFRDFEQEDGSTRVENWDHGMKEYYTESREYMISMQCGTLYSYLAPVSSDISIAAPWDKIYRKNFLVENDLYFPSALKVLDDMVFNFECLAKATKIGFFTDRLYHYCIHKGENSSITNRYKPDRVEQDMAVFAYLQDKIYKEKVESHLSTKEIKEKLQTLDDAFSARVIKSYAICCRLCFFNKENFGGNLLKQKGQARKYMSEGIYQSAFRNVKWKSLEWKLKFVRLSGLLKMPELLHLLYVLQSAVQNK